MKNYVSFDIEATGLGTKIEKIIEIGAVKVINGKITDKYSTLVNPGRTLTPRIIELTGICDTDLKDAPTIEEVIGEFITFTEDLPVLGHHLLTDYAFIKQAAVNKGLSFEKEGVDTLKIARACLPLNESKRLGDLCRFYDIDMSAHRAYNDALATHRLFECLKGDFLEKVPELFIPAKLVFKVKKETPIRKGQKERLERLIDMYKVECPYDLNQMSQNEASRYADVLIATYGRSQKK